MYSDALEGKPSASASVPSASTGAAVTDDFESCGGSESCSLASYSSKSGLLTRINRRLRQKSSLLNDIVHRQTFYAYCVKLLALFIIALVHFLYIRPFLDTLTLLEDYSAKVATKFATTEVGRPAASSSSAAPVAVLPDGVALYNAKIILRHEVDVLNDYKKNVWMTVAAMCVALSTSCFFLFILPITRTVRRFQLFLIGTVDLVSFAALPMLLLARAELVTRIIAGLPESLRVSHRIVSAEKLMNALQCTIHPREKLAFCSDVLVDSVFPIILLKYLVILCFFTMAYIILAYIIDYCLKHWFPPHDAEQRGTLPACYHATGCASVAAARKSSLYFNHSQCFPADGCDCGMAAWSATDPDCGCFGYDNKKSFVGKKTYLPAMLIPVKGKSGVGDEFIFGVRQSMPTLLPNPLAGQLSPLAAPLATPLPVPTLPQKAEVLPQTVDSPAVPSAIEPFDPK